MAEFCLECFKKINGKEVEGKKYITSKDLDFCEGCGEWKPVVIAERGSYYRYKLRYIIFPFWFIAIILYFLLRVLILPYFIIKYVIFKKQQ